MHLVSFFVCECFACCLWERQIYCMITVVFNTVRYNNTNRQSKLLAGAGD
jgi:hypothetical protein